MIKSTIQFIACDIDGTMLRNGEKVLSKRLLDNIARIVDMGIIFAPASGRQYPTMKKMFGDIQNELMYICENGALVVYKGDILYKSVMDKETVIEIAKDIYNTPNCEVLLSGKDISYMKPKNRAYFDRIRDKIKNNIYICNSFDKLDDEFIKIAACDLSGIENSKDGFIAKWGDKVQTAVSGELYIDFTCKGVNKGSAIKSILKERCIDVCNAMAFGDSFNDVEMLNMVEYSYAMSDAHDKVKIYAKYETEDINEILEKVIRENE